jgi:hypothetical protein
VVRPTLIFYVQLKDGMAIDASLSPDARNYLASLVDKQRKIVGLSPSCKEQCEGDLYKDASTMQ